MKCWKYILMLCGCCVLCSCSKPTQEAKFYDYNVIAHAGGGIDGNIYTDSLEALNQSYQNGTRLFDIDGYWLKLGMSIVWSVMISELMLLVCKKWGEQKRIVQKETTL